MTRYAALSWVSAVTLVVACGVGEGEGPSDGGVPEAAPASGEPPPIDGGGTVDAGRDAEIDAASDAGVDADADAAPPFVDYDVNHVLLAGQSNSVGNSGTPVLSTTQPYANLRFDTGVLSMKGRPSDANLGCDGEGCSVYETPTGFLPLVEGDQYFDYAVETPASGLGNEISMLATARYGLPKHDVLVSAHGRSGNTYWCLRKPVTPIAGTKNSMCDYKAGYLSSYSQGLMEVTSGKTLAAAAGKSYVVRAVAVVHGESDDDAVANGGWELPLDAHDGTPGAIASYTDALLEWQRDYETDIRAITGQAEPVPLFVSQLSGWTHGPFSRVAQEQLDAHVKAPGKVVLVGPSYHLALDKTDCLHFTNAGERRLGEYFAKVYAEVVFAKKTWEPVRPKTITRAGSVITVELHVPKPPLVIDHLEVAAATNEGFTYVDDAGAGAPAIANVAIVSPTQVAITLTQAPTSTGRRLRYAMNQVKDACVGTPEGARGNVRDSDDTPSRTGTPLHNWAVNFEIAVP